MELKVFRQAVQTCGTRWETRLELPVETELLVPDYQPAVFKIVKCLIEPVVLQNRVAGGRWQGEGYLRCTVYYQSDEAGCRLYRTEQKFSFEKTADLPEGQFPEGPARLWGELEYCNCRCVSEHRIDIRGAYILCAAALAVEQTDLLTSLADCGIEQRTMPLTGSQLAAAEEKTCTAETTIPLPGTGEAILDIGGLFSRQAVSVQSGQVEVKGTLSMQVCYRSPGVEELSTRSREVPVQQLLELPAAEGDTALVWGEVLACTLAAPENGDSDPALTVTWRLHCEVWRPVTYMAVADAYSTLCETAVTRADCCLIQEPALLEETLHVEVEDDLPDPEVEVRGCFLTLSAAQAVPGEDGVLHLQGKGIAHVLCADARGELTCYDKPFTWQQGCWTAAPQELLPHVQVAVSRVSSGKTGARLRVEAELALTGGVLTTRTAQVVSEVALGEEFPDKAEGPALYLYYAGAGERLFDIARRYHARAKDLAQANGLDPAQETTAQAACLLIPAAL